jgi:translation initiation factor 3 subunit C
MAKEQLKGKLWGGDSSSSDSSDSSSDDDTPAVTAMVKDTKPRKNWADEESSSEDEERKPRKVVSHADKRYDEMKECIKKMKDHKKINDFAALVEDYELSIKKLEKLKNLVEQEGGPPSFFIRACTDLEIFCEETHELHKKNKEEGGPRLNENKARAFNTLRAKVKKSNKQYEDLIAQCREDPEKFAEAEEEESEKSESESSSSSAGSASGSSDKSDSDSDSGSSDSDSDSDSNSSSSSGSGSSKSSKSSSDDSESWKDKDEDDDSDTDDEEAVREKKMLRWLITPEQAAKVEKKEAERKQKEEEAKKIKDKPKSAKTVKDKGDKDEGTKPKDAKKEYTPKELMDKISEITSVRGRRGFDKKDFMTKLQNLEEHAEKQGPRTHLYLLCQMISADFDGTGGIFDAMKISIWIEARDKMLRMFPLLKESYEQPADDDDGADKAEDDPKTHHKLEGSCVDFLERRDRELYKALLFTNDVYGTEYQDILANSSKFLKLLMKSYLFFKETKQSEPRAITSLLLMDQLYYRPDSLNRAVFEAISHDVPEEEKSEWQWPEDSTVFMAQLCNHVYAGGTMRDAARRSENNDDGDAAAPTDQSRWHITCQKRATLHQAYHLALHNKFEAARNLLHLGTLYEKATESDVNLQILYNRVIAQLGLCGFRLAK